MSRTVAHVAKRVMKSIDNETVGQKPRRQWNPEVVDRSTQHSLRYPRQGAEVGKVIPRYVRKKAQSNHKEGIWCPAVFRSSPARYVATVNRRTARMRDRDAARKAASILNADMGGFEDAEECFTEHPPWYWGIWSWD